MSLSGYRQAHVSLAIRAVHEELQISLQLLCEVARVPRSSYYKWVNHKPSQREQENKQLMERKEDVRLLKILKMDGCICV